MFATAVLVAPLRWLPPLTTSFMLITRANHPQDELRYEWAARGAISRHAAAAVLAAEDQRFFRHAGFDLREIGTAIAEYREGERLRGGSTISQQVAKNLFLWPGRSWLRKGVEAWLTVWLELLLPKERILELHLNIAQFGPLVFGIETASRHYFAKPAAGLNRQEAALLAAVLPSPERYSVSRPTAYMRGRQAWIIEQAARLERQGYFPLSGWH